MSPTATDLSSPPSTADPHIFIIKAATLRFDTRESLVPYVTPLIENPVEEVYLSGNTYGIEACAFLGEILAKKTTLKVAGFADIFSTRLRTEIPQSLGYLLDAIVGHDNLHTINLSDNAFGSTAQAPLIKFLSTHLPLQHLFLANNGLGPEAGGNIANALAALGTKKGQQHPPLKTLVCGRNRLGDASMDPWARCFSVNRELTTVRMPQNGIRPEGIAVILKNGIIHDTKMEILDLQDNTFTLKGALALADILPSLSKLKDLGVGDCLLSARGGVVVAEALKGGENKELQVLRLQYNEIETSGAQGFLSAVKLGLPQLKMIEMNGNKFAEDDQVVEEFRSLFLERGFGELDELDDMEEVSDEEVSDEEEEEEEEGVGSAEGAKHSINEETKEEEEQDVAPEQDEEADALADQLAKTSI